MTTSELKNMIRDCESLEEVFKIVGPSDYEVDESRCRMKKMEDIYNRYKGFESMPDFMKKTYEDLGTQQAAYEGKYF